ncbi:MAG: V-type ATPase subunit [Clostridia bacterium]|nr:V-type ATPase subunit [Clostridia bacterium]
MARDLLYTNGVVAAREKYLLKDKILKLCESSAEETFRTLTEGGFGKGAEVGSVYDYEKLVTADEQSIDEFIREYAPSQAEQAYLLSERDFHNAKAILKAYYLHLEVEKLLAPEGLISIRTITDCIKDGNYSPLGGALSEAVSETAKLFESEGDVSGAEIGIIFEKARFKHLVKTCSKNGVLKKLIAVRADMTNILTALRSSESEYAQKSYVEGGKLSIKQLDKLFSDNAEKALEGTPYSGFLKKCLKDKAEGLPLTDAERVFESYETEFFAQRKYELEKAQPFLYYVFRRRAENANVRILFVCLLAGMRDIDIKRRLRTI